MAEPRTPNVPVLGPGELYVYSHANGAIFLLKSDGRSRVVPMATVVDLARGCHAAGHRVVVGWDEAPIARDVVEAITAAQVPIVEYDAPRPPHTWEHGTNALIEAAALGIDPILDDIIERGVDIHHVDDSGSTALHHAATRGSLHAIEVLVAAGAEVDLVNDRGMTPHMLAMTIGQTRAAELLVSLGADLEGHLESLRFAPSHYGVLYCWVAPAVGWIAILATALWPLGLVDGLVVLVLVALFRLVVPPRAFWAGGVPRALEGTTLVIRDLWGRRREIDLSEVTAAAVAGNPTRSGTLGARWLILGHPDGAPIDARAIRRLRVPGPEVEAVAEHIDRAVVVQVGAGKGDEVILPVGNVLAGRGVLRSTTLRRQVNEARAKRDRGPEA